MNKQKIKMSLLGIVLSIGLIGCSGVMSDVQEGETGLNSMQQEESVYITPEFTKESYEIYDEEELIYSLFETQITDKDKIYNIRLEWAVKNDDLMIKNVEELPSGWSLKKVKGNSDYVFLLVGEKQGYIRNVYMCELPSNNIKPVFQENISDYFVYGIEVSTDLKHVVLNTDERDYYYNGTELISLAEVCGLEVAQRVVGTLVGEEVLISATDEKNLISFYVYKPSGNTCKATIQLQADINIDDRNKGFKRYGDAYATDYLDGYLVVWNLTTGNRQATDISLSMVEDIFSIDDETLLVITNEKKLVLVDKEADKDVLHDVAMQIAAAKPAYIVKEEVPAEEV